MPFPQFRPPGSEGQTFDGARIPAAEPELRTRFDHIVMNLKDRIRFLERDVFPNYERIYGA